jgi:acyl-CoA reductase-like NAD-dependent aldehyde dehydrogenase
MAQSSQVPLWINGETVLTAETFDVTAPDNGDKLWSSSTANVDDANRAVNAAHAAFPAWRRTKPGVIQGIFIRAADLLESQADELVAIWRQETGALEGVARWLIQNAISNIRDVSGRAANIHGSIVQVQSDDQVGHLMKQPYGVVVGIAPWNAAFILGTRAFTFPLVAGNTVVLKGSEFCPRTFEALVRIFDDAGLPKGVLNFITTQSKDAAAVTNALIEHPAVRKINFTGSTAVGRIIASKAGQELKPVVLELGGKASAIICEDADIELAVSQCVPGTFMHAGQTCMSTERILVHETLYDVFLSKFKSGISNLYPEDGPAPLMTSASTAEKNRSLVEDALRKGAETHTIGDSFPVSLSGTSNAGEDASTNGASKAENNHHQVRPTIITKVTSDMNVYHEESFGPTVSVLAVRSDDEALSIANDTPYGLSSAIFTKDLARGLRMARELDSGAVHINSMSVHDEHALPHGGFKASGWGRFNGQHGVDEFLQTKVVTYMQ